MNPVAPAKVILEDTAELYSSGAMWNNTFRQRAYENALARLHARASRPSAMHGKPEAAQLGEELANLAVSLDERKSFLDALRRILEKYIRSELDDEDKHEVRIFKLLLIGDKSSIFTTLAVSLLSPTSPIVETAALVLKAVKNCPDDVLSIGLLLRGSQQDKVNAQTVSNNLVALVIDRLTKRTPQREFVAAMASTGFNELDRPMYLDVESTEINKYGYTNQRFKDLRILAILAQGVGCMMDNKTMSRDSNQTSRMGSPSTRLSCRRK